MLPTPTLELLYIFLINYVHKDLTLEGPKQHKEFRPNLLVGLLHTETYVCRQFLQYKNGLNLFELIARLMPDSLITLCIVQYRKNNVIALRATDCIKLWNPLEQAGFYFSR